MLAKVKPLLPAVVLMFVVLVVYKKFAPATLQAKLGV